MDKTSVKFQKDRTKPVRGGGGVGGWGGGGGGGVGGWGGGGGVCAH